MHNFLYPFLKGSTLFRLTARIGAVMLSSALLTAQAQTTVPSKVQGEYAVSTSGTAVYRIPIQVPPGIAGMEPKLALVYNSWDGNGLMGMGWGIEGLSAITRCPKTMATDRQRSAITHTLEDRFCMDGKRLININGEYGAAGSEYRTEIDSFSKIVAVGQFIMSVPNTCPAGKVCAQYMISTPTGPSSFIVKTKSGLTLEYGSTTDSRIEAVRKEIGNRAVEVGVRAWALSRMYDVSGNSISFSYTEDSANGAFNIESITYANDRRVSFTYEPRPDVLRAFVAGVETSLSKRLIGISNYVGPNIVTAMGLEYKQVPYSSSSILSKISLCAQGGTCAVPLNLEHIQGGVLASTIQHQSSTCKDGDTSNGACNNADNYNYFRFADVNGDGLTDFCFRSDSASVGIVCMKNQGAPNYWSDPAPIKTGVCGSGSTAFGVCNGVDNFDYISFVDVNADGMSDLVYRSDNGMRVHTSTGSSFVQAWESTLCKNGDTSNGTCNDVDNFKYFRFADVNGDGLTDFCFRSDSASVGIVCMRNQGAPNYWSDPAPIKTGVCGNGSTAFGTCNDADNFDYVSFVDVNSDGMSDLVYRSDNGMRVWISTGSSFVQAWESTLCKNGDTSNGTCNDADNFKYFRYADVNGDGLTDFCFRSDSASVGIVCMRNQGAPSYWSDPAPINTGVCGNGSAAFGGCNDVSNFKSIDFLDVNADGMADLVYRSDNGMRVRISTGAGFVQAWDSTTCKDGDATNGSCNDANNHDYIQWVVARAGQPPQLFYRSDAGIRLLTPLIANGSSRGFISKVRSGLQLEVGFVYGESYQENSGSYVYPAFRIPRVSMLVRQVAVPTGTSSDSNSEDGPVNLINFDYGDMKGESASVKPEHVGSGRGLLGFRWMKRVEESTGIETYTEFAQSWPHFGMVTRGETRIAGKGNAGVLKLAASNLGCWMTGMQEGMPALTSSQTPCYMQNIGRVVFPYVLNSTESSWDLNGVQMPTLFSGSIYGGYADEVGAVRQFGDPTQITVEITEGGVLKHRKVTTNQFVPAKTDGQNWQIGRINRASVTSTQY